MSPTNASNNDLSRDLGHLEGQFVGMKDDITDIKKFMERIDNRLAKIEARESQLRGAWWVLVVIAALASSVLTVITSHFWK